MTNPALVCFLAGFGLNLVIIVHAMASVVQIDQPLDAPAVWSSNGSESVDGTDVRSLQIIAFTVIEAYPDYGLYLYNGEIHPVLGSARNLPAIPTHDSADPSGPATAVQLPQVEPTVKLPPAPNSPSGHRSAGSILLKGKDLSIR